MGCLGLHFALTESEVAKLKSLPDDAKRLEFVQEDLEEDFWSQYKEYVVETDKAWDAIHRILSDGYIEYGNGEYPLSHVIMGGEVLYGNDDYVMVLKTPSQVADAAPLLGELSEEIFRERYFEIDPIDYGVSVDDEDCDYTWHWFCKLREFWARAARSKRYVLFTASQ